MSSKIHLRLGTLLVAMLWLAMCAWVAVDLQAAHEQEQRAAERIGDTLARVLEGHLQAVVRRVDLRLLEFADRYQYAVAEGREGDEIAASLATSRQNFPEMFSFRVVDARGRYLFDASGQLANDVNIADRDYFTRLRDDPQAGLVVSEVLQSRVNGAWVVVLARRLEDRQGKFAGVVLSAIRSAYFEDFYRSLNFDGGSAVALWKQDMQLLARWPALPEQLGRRIADRSVSDQLAQGHHDGTFAHVLGLDGVQRLFAFRAPGDLPFIVTVGMSEDSVFASWRQRVRIYAILGGILTLALLALVAAWTRTYRHAVQLAATMTRAVTEKNREGRALLDAIPDPAWLLDTEGRYLAVNEAFCRHIGMPMGAVVGRTVDELFSAEEAERLRAGQQEVYQQRAALRQLVILQAGGKPTPYEFLRVPVFAEDGVTPRGLAGVAWDISVRYEAEARQRLIAHVFDHSSELLLILAADFRILTVNNAFVRLTGYAPELVQGRLPRELAGEACDDGFFDAIAEHLRNGQSWSGEAWVHCRDGIDRPLRCNATPIADQQGAIENWMVFMTDLSERKAAEARIEALANYDQLTELPNRQGFLRRLAEWLGQRRGGALVLLDLDQLSRVNDAFGHEAGDLLLRKLGERLRRQLRDSDVLGRLGGDQFGAIIDLDVDELTAVEAVIRKLLDSVARPVVLRGNEVVCTACAGICLLPRDGDECNVLLRNADAAMHQAKASGAGSFRFFSADMNRLVAERLRLESDLRMALARHELRLHYQPQIDIASGRLTGFECLLRWQHPEFGLVPPLHFIPLAEETRLILPIGAWVLEEACRDASRWRDQGLPPLVVAVNISAVQFQEDDLVGRVGRALAASGLPADCLELEITESVLMQDPEQVVGMLEQLKHLGVRLSIDDFGTGYSSLAYLQRFPIDKIKIDKSFIQDLADGSDNSAIVRMVIGMARELDRKVIAEGVERETQLAFLAAHACDEYQGFLCSPAVPAEQVPALLAAVNGQH